MKHAFASSKNRTAPIFKPEPKGSIGEIQRVLGKEYPNKEVERIEISDKELEGELDLSEYPNIKEIALRSNNLISINFLNTLPNPEKLEEIILSDNKIKPTNISVFSKFINLKFLLLGTNDYYLQTGKHNKFFGSLKSLQNLNKLEQFCIEATDISEGLEYLPMSLLRNQKEKMRELEGEGYENYYIIQCSPHGLDVGCKKIQDQLRPFNYDLEA
jgi:hypothetical protein